MGDMAEEEERKNDGFVSSRGRRLTSNLIRGVCRLPLSTEIHNDLLLRDVRYSPDHTQEVMNKVLCYARAGILVYESGTALLCSLALHIPQHTWYAHTRYPH